jgi:hypothetical protein
MKYSYIDIKTFFEKAKYKMQTPREGKNYINSSEKKKLGFTIFSDARKVIFCWCIKEGTLLNDKFPLIQRKYPKAKINHGKINDKWTRLYIPLDQKKPLTDALDVLKKTKGILGYK